MRVHYINLARQAERRDEFLRTNGSIAEFCRFDAVDGGQITQEDLISRGIVAEPLRLFTARALGSALSQKRLWEKCIEEGETMTIAEDDAVFHAGFRDKSCALLGQLPADWDIVRWSWNMDSILHVEVLPGLKECVMAFDPTPLGAKKEAFQEADFEARLLPLIQAFGISCYSISPKGARSLLEACFPLSNVVVPSKGMGRSILTSCLDVTMNKYYAALKSYVCFPPLVWSDNVKNSP